MDKQENPQTKLFHEDIYDAITTAILALGGFKKVASRLRPDLKQESAYAWLKVCVKRDGDQNLNPEQLSWVRREAAAIGCHVLAEYESDDAGYEKPVIRSPRDKLAELQSQFIDCVGKQSQIAERIERLLNPLKAVK